MGSLNIDNPTVELESVVDSQGTEIFDMLSPEEEQLVEMKAFQKLEDIYDELY